MKNEKVVDAVKMMRQIRDKMTNEMREMSFKEKKKYVENRAREVIQKLSLQKIRGAA